MPEQPTQKPAGKSTEQRIADLEAQLAAAQTAPPLGTIAEHGAGPGTEVAETWSMYDQELAAAGIHPDQGPEPKD